MTMTREEAIIELKKKITCTIGGLSKEEYNATVMAIEALLSVPNCQKCAIKELWEETEKEDLVSVVRCKDCRWWNSETKGCKRNPSVEAWHETDFCKYGERQCNYFGERREE